MARESILSGPWPSGINSLVDPMFVKDDQVQWSVNTINRGGTYQTRPGYNLIGDDTIINGVRAYALRPRGITVFSPRDGDPIIVKAVGTIIRFLRYPFTSNTWATLSGITLDDSRSPVYFEVATKGAVTHDDGRLETVTPYQVLMIQTGVTRAAYWDGAVAKFLDPTKGIDPLLPGKLSETPIGTIMKFINGRLWVATDKGLRVSNVLDPLKFTEENILAEGGTFTLPGQCTGLASTADQQALLAFTATTGTAFRADILDRSQWTITPGFQKLILPEIGCAAPFSITNQYGITWWYSQGGFIGLDGALQTYRTSKIKYKDQNMARSKGNLSNDISGICVGAFENFLMVSVPSGDSYNAHTWVMDQSVIDELNAEAAPAWASCWTGTRPVQWITTNVKGQSRCFFLSRDYPPTGDVLEFRSGVWEAFTPNKFDYGKSLDNTKVAKPILCSLETKLLTKNSGYGTFDHFKVRLRQLTGVAGTIHVDGFYASAHAGYKQVLSKDIIATTDSLNTAQVAADISTLLPALVPQVRTLRSDQDQAQLTDNDDGVEESYTRNKDTAFSILLKWTGQAGVAWIICYYDMKGEIPEGKVEVNETRVRTVAPSGDNFITTDAPKIHSIFSGLTSGNVVVVSPRWSEDAYSSMS